MWLPSCPWSCFTNETNVQLIGFSEIGEDVDSGVGGGGGHALPRIFFEVFIANGAFWINLDHQLRADFYHFLVILSAANYFILVIVNVMYCFFYRHRHKEGCYW